MQTALTPQIGSAAAHDQSYGLIYQTLQQQASLWSYMDQFRMLVIVCLLCAPLVFLFKKPKRAALPGDLAASALSILLPRSIDPYSHRSQLAMQAPQKAEKENQSESIDNPGVEDKDVQLLAEVILVRTKKHISRLCGVVLLLHLRVSEHVRDLSILEKLFRRHLIAAGIKFFAIEPGAVDDPIDLVHFLIHLTGILCRQARRGSPKRPLDHRAGRSLPGLDPFAWPIVRSCR